MLINHAVKIHKQTELIEFVALKKLGNALFTLHAQNIRRRRTTSPANRQTFPDYSFLTARFAAFLPIHIGVK